MNIVLGLLGMLAGVAMIKYRESIGELFENSDWMKYFGGPCNFAIALGIFLFFLSLAKMTGTTDFLLQPLMWMLPGVPKG